MNCALITLIKSILLLGMFGIFWAYVAMEFMILREVIENKLNGLDSDHGRKKPDNGAAIFEATVRSYRDEAIKAAREHKPNTGPRQVVRGPSQGKAKLQRTKIQ